jgi:hypothetical protein
MAHALGFEVLQDCTRPVSAAVPPQSRSPPSGGSDPHLAHEPGIAINVTAAEFYASFASIFRLLDGSRISAPRMEKTESLRYMQGLLYMIGVHVNETASRSSPYPGDILQVCWKVRKDSKPHDVESPCVCVCHSVCVTVRVCAVCLFMRLRPQS